MIAASRVKPSSTSHRCQNRHEKQVGGGSRKKKRNALVPHFQTREAAGTRRHKRQGPRMHTPTTAGVPAAPRVVLLQTAKENSSRHCSQKKILIGRSETLVRREISYIITARRAGGEGRQGGAGKRKGWWGHRWCGAGTRETGRKSRQGVGAYVPLTEMDTRGQVVEQKA